ncbi:MAG: hypothetical protein GX625_06525 [Clostridiaceae bacterium]|nr:hypothetical protein [Clostridiaceae bacterium]
MRRKKLRPAASSYLVYITFCGSIFRMVSYITEQIKVLDISKKYKDVKTVLWAIDYRTVDIKAGDVYLKNVKMKLINLMPNLLSDILSQE